jgi:hypothetical protein
VAEFREAIRLDPRFARGHAYLGFSLFAMSDFDAARAALRRAGPLAGSEPRLAARIDRELRQVEQHLALLARIPAVLRGDEEPADAAELMTMARAATHRQHQFTRTARLIARSLEAHPEWADFDQDPPRYYGAVCATVAATDRNETIQTERPPDAELPGFRKQAFEWLSAELSHQARQWADGAPEKREDIRKALEYWTIDGWLAGLRDESRLVELLEAEQTPWRALWDEVRALLKRSRGDPPP